MIQIYNLGIHLLTYIRTIGQFLLEDKMEWIQDVIPYVSWLFDIFPGLEGFLDDLSKYPIAFLIFGGGLTAFLLYKLIKFLVGIFGG